MRRLVVALIVALMVVTLAGCGAEPEAEPAPDPATDGAAPVAPTAEVAEVLELSPVEESVFVPFPIDPEVGVPESIQSRLDAKQPMVILFMDKTQQVSGEQRRLIDGVLETYRGLIDLVVIDLSRFVTHDANGAITVDPAINEDEAGRQTARMIDVNNLDIRFTPFTLIVDEQGYVTWRYRGLSDDKTLEREILRITE